MIGIPISDMFCPTPLDPIPIYDIIASMNSTDASFLARATEDLRLQQEKAEQIRRTIDILEQRLTEVLAESHRLAAAIEIVRSYVSPTIGSSTGLEGYAIPKSATTAEIVRVVLRAAKGRPFTTKELISELVECGKFRADNKNNYTLLMQAIGDKPEFERRQPGVWGLREDAEEGQMQARLAGLREGGANPEIEETAERPRGSESRSGKENRSRG
jgi:hypothetical protein